LGAEIDEYCSDVRYERIAILNAFGAYYSYLGKIETKQREKEEHFILATQYYNKASRIDMHEPSTWVGKGVVFGAPLCYCISNERFNWLAI
jgi:RNA polymerase-associated protein CTR9